MDKSRTLATPTGVFGGLPQTTPKADARLVAQADGTFTVDIWAQDKATPAPSIKIAMTCPGGSPVLIDSTQTRVYTRQDKDIVTYVFELNGQNTTLPTGTYELAAYVNGNTLVRKFITIQSTPF